MDCLAGYVFAIEVKLVLEPAGRNVGCGFLTGLMEVLRGFHVSAISVESGGIDA